MANAQVTQRTLSSIRCMPHGFIRRCSGAPLTQALILFLLVMTQLAASGMSIWYVSPSGSDSNSGTSWSSPLATVAKAISKASSGDQVWVKEGTYQISSAINLIEGVSVYGGFNGTETMLSQRNWVTNVTILTGVNSSRIVYAGSGVASDTLLDGFTITNGSGGGDLHGGGIRCDGSPTISDNIISNCSEPNSSSSSGYGGGIFCNTSSQAIIRNNTIEGNSAYYGGGLYSQGSATISNNIFGEQEPNSAYQGGALYTAAGDSITGNTFEGNTASYGGAIYASGAATIGPRLPSKSGGNSFYNNTAGQGGALYTSSTAVINANTFGILSGGSLIGNIASGGGGAICSNNASGQITNNTLLGNEASNGSDGGGIYVNSGSPNISGNSIVSNQATDTSTYSSGGGGGIYCNGGYASITNNTLSSNTSKNYGGGISLTGFGGTVANNVGIDPTSGLPGISQNTATYYGGGIYGYSGYSSPGSAPHITITNNIVSGNLAGYGGGIFEYYENSTVSYNQILGNYANYGNNSGGAGIYEDVSNSTLQGNTIEQNGTSAGSGNPTSYGGGIYLYQGAPFVTNNLVAHNTAGLDGAGLIINNSAATVANNTIANNTLTGSSGGGISITSNSTSPKLANNIIVANTSGILNQGGGSVTLSHNDVYNNTNFNYSGLSPDSNSISADPIFVNGYHIPYGSPCISAGDFSYVTTNELDHDGNPRSRDGATVDIGCYEYTSASVGLTGFSVSSTSLCSQVTATGTVTLASAAPAPNGTIVYLASGNPGLVTMPPSVIVPAGATSVTFTITAGITATTETTALYAALSGTVLSVNMAVSPLLGSLSFNPYVLFSGVSLGSVNLNCPAPAPTTISLTSSNSSVSVPASVTVPAGATGATFKVLTTATSTFETVMITATNGIESATGTLYVDPTATLSALTISPSSVIGGGTVFGVVTLKSAVPTGSGGVDVALSVNAPTASVPAVVTVPEGHTQASFLINTTAVAVTQAISVTASLGSVNKSAKLTINPITVAAVSLVPSTAYAGEDVIFIVTLTAPAGAGGVTVTLPPSDNPGVAAPAEGSLVIPAGQTYGSVYVNTFADGVANIGATVGGKTKTAKLTVKN